MTDNKSPQKNTHSKQTAADKKPKSLHDNEEKPDISNSQSQYKAKASNTLDKPKISTNKNNTNNKIAWLALFIALSAGASIAGLYYWQNQQQSQLVKQLSQQIKQQKQQLIQQNKQQTQTLLAQQQKAFEHKIQQAINNITQQQQAKLAQLETAVARLSQRQPSDWLIHESEYLIRVAARSIWLERNTSAAINLLKDADKRLKQLNNPKFFPVRQLIHQDIEQLSLLPQRETDEVILSLIGLNQQINKLPLSKITRLDEKTTQQAFELSENPADWQTNLKKSWQKFLSDFITIRRRNNNVEPLLSPEYQQNLRQNLSLKLQLAQWAANQGNSQVYQAALNDVLAWQQQYFDMDAPSNQNFKQAITKLTKAIIDVNYPKTLSSLQAMHQLLNEKTLPPLTEQETSKEKEVTTDKKINTIQPIEKETQPAEKNNTVDKKQTNGAII